MTKMIHRLTFRIAVAFLGMYSIVGCTSVEINKELNSQYNHLLRDVEDEIPVASDIEEYVDLLKNIRFLTIEKAVEIALMNNPDLNSIKERVKESAEKYPQAISFDDPVLSIGIYPSTIVSSNSDFSYKVGLAQRFPYPGKLALKGKIALKEAEAELGDFRSARLELILSVKSSYLALFYIYRAIEINGEERRILDELKTTVTSNYAAGKGSLQEPAQAGMELARVEHRGITLDRMLRVAGARLNTLMGRESSLPLPPPAGLWDVKKFSDKEALVEEALSNNPDIRAARLKKGSARVSLKLARMQYYPDFTVMGSYNRAWMTDELRPFVGIGINVPIRFGRLDAGEREAKAKSSRLGFKLRAVMDRVRYEVEAVFHKLEESSHVKKHFLNTLLPATELNFEAARAGYKEGKNDFITLIAAEKALIKAKLEYEHILVNMRTREAELSRIIGEKP